MFPNTLSRQFFKNLNWRPVVLSPLSLPPKLLPASNPIQIQSRKITGVQARPAAPRPLAPHSSPLSLNIQHLKKNEERPLRAHFPVPSYLQTKEDEQYGFEIGRKLGREPHLPLL
jgi:hypothetical protein